jgi:CRP-like cAMP-binding protein
MEGSPKNKTEKFFAAYKEQRFSRGQILIFSGEISKDVFFLTSGKAKKYSTNYKGEEIILTTFKKGTFFPVSQAIHQNMPNRYYYAAETDMTAYRAPATEVYEFMMQHPDELMALLKRVYNGLDEMLGRVVTLVATNALGRVIYELVVTTRKLGTMEPSGHYFLDINERGIGARTGLTRETVNREIRKLKDAGFVEIERRGIVVKNLAGLEAKLYKELI